MNMNLKNLKISRHLMLAAIIASSSAMAMADEQYTPLLVARTGPAAEQARPLANGTVDFMTVLNAKGGVNGVKLNIEECEFGYDAARGVECYERMKSKHGGAIALEPWSTGAAYTLMEKAPKDKINLILTTGYGSSAAADGEVFEWLFPVGGSYWVAMDTTIQFLGKNVGGLDTLKGKKIAYVYYDVPYGKEPIPILKKRSEMHGFNVVLLPVTPPGLNQQGIWSRIRQEQPDYIILWTFGISSPIALEEARKIGFPRDKMYGSFWSGTDADVAKEGEKAKGYYAAVYQSSAAYNAPITKDALKLYEQGKGAGGDRYKNEVGSVLWLRGAMSAMYMAEGIRTAQEKYGKGKIINSEQMRWGLENMKITEQKAAEYGLPGLVAPMQLTCKDHMGTYKSRVAQWTGAEWKIVTDWIEADRAILDPLIKAGADDYAKKLGLTRRSCN